MRAFTSSISMPKRLYRWMTCTALLVAVPPLLAPIVATPLGAQQTARERERERLQREREREREAERRQREQELRDRNAERNRDEAQYRSRVDTTIAFNK